jgi:hypothetical protein
MVWQPLKSPPAYHHAIIQKVYADVVLKYDISRSLTGLLLKAVWLWPFFFGPVLTLPILMALFYLPYNFSLRQLGARTRFLLFVLVVFVSGLLLEVFHSPHYAAPATCLFIALVLLCMRRLRAWQWKNKPVGLFLTRAIPVICVLSFLMRAAAGPLHIPLPESHAPAWFQRGPSSFGRAQLAAQLEKLPGKQLVIVRYEDTHQPFDEWVYNDANIDASKVVWAHAMSPREDKQLIDYFPGREVLLWEPDHIPPRMSPYHLADGSSSLGSDKSTD